MPGVFVESVGKQSTRTGICVYLLSRFVKGPTTHTTYLVYRDVYTDTLSLDYLLNLNPIPNPFPKSLSSCIVPSLADFSSLHFTSRVSDYIRFEWVFGSASPFRADRRAN